MYIGYLIRASASVIRRARATGDRLGFLNMGMRVPTDFGDPIFVIGGDDSSIQFYARVSSEMTISVSKAFQKYGDLLGVNDAGESEELTPRAMENTVQLIIALEVCPLSPAISLDSLNIAAPPDNYIECDPLQVLQILKSIPSASRTAWVQRVVDRNNDL